MYNDEIFDALEDAYNDGYNQAMLDMDDSYIDDEDMYDEVYEDVDMFDDDYFEAMEGPAREYRHKQNEGKSREQIRNEREKYYSLPNDNYDLYSSDKNRSSSRESNKNGLIRSIDERRRDKNLKYNRGPVNKNRYSSNNLGRNMDLNLKRDDAIKRDFNQGKITRKQYDKLYNANRAAWDKYCALNSGVAKIDESIRQRKR